MLKFLKQPGLPLVWRRRPSQGEKISFKPALAQPGETTTSKNKTGTD